MKIKFIDKAHEDFFYTNMEKCRYKDVYHYALIYTLGINQDTRNHIDRIYDFASGCIKPECIHDGWQTSGSMKVVRLAFNLYTDGTPTIGECTDAEEQIRESSNYSVSDIMCSGYATYFMEAIKIRYPEYF